MATKLPMYKSPTPETTALGHNAIAWDWKRLEQILSISTEMVHPTDNSKTPDKQEPLIVLPWYPAEPWFPYIVNRATNHWELQSPDPIKNERPASETWTAFNF